ncbi:MAG: alcohol dehydrogenase catalytic domain-containing protein [Fimbriimonadales bacterium]
MMTNHAWLFTQEATLEWHPMPVGEPDAGEVLVRLRACGLCTGEVMDWYIRRKAPLVPGHELVGTIERVGSGVNQFREGERVIVHHHAPCGQCDLCRRGAYVHCPTWRATKLRPGGLSERFVVPPEIVRSDLLRVPDSVSDERAVFAEPLACVVKSLRRAGLKHGSRIAVIGLGVMGMLHILLAHWWGAKTVYALDLLPHRLAFAEQLGAIPLPPDSAPPDPAPEIVIVGPGVESALALAWNLVAPDGTLLLFTPTPPEARYPYDWHTAYFKEIRLIPSYSAGPNDMRQALALLVDGLPVERLITHQLPLSEVPQGYQLLRKAEALKVVVSAGD